MSALIFLRIKLKYFRPGMASLTVAEGWRRAAGSIRRGTTWTAEAFAGVGPNGYIACPVLALGAAGERAATGGVEPRWDHCRDKQQQHARVKHCSSAVSHQLQAQLLAADVTASQATLLAG